MLNISTVKTGEKMIHEDVNGAKLPIFYEMICHEMR